MTLADDIAAAAAKTGADAQAAADRVTASLADASAALVQAQTDLADYIAAHPDETGTLQGVKDSLSATDDLINSIDAAPTA
jgi:hypothetical protein